MTLDELRVIRGRCELAETFRSREQPRMDRPSPQKSTNIIYGRRVAEFVIYAMEIILELCNEIEKLKSQIDARNQNNVFVTTTFVCVVCGERYETEPETCIICGGEVV